LEDAVAVVIHARVNSDAAVLAMGTGRLVIETYERRVTLVTCGTAGSRGTRRTHVTRIPRAPRHRNCAKN
jgi:hypothetical protein